MLHPGDKVTITISEPGGPLTQPGWIVISYDNGLLKVKRDNETKIYNMRSLDFRSAEIER